MPPLLRRFGLAAVLLLGLATAAAAQPVDFYGAWLAEPVNPRGGVVEPDRPLEVVAETARPAHGAEVRIVYSADGWTTTHTTAARAVRHDAGPFGNNTEWRGTIGPFRSGATVEYYVEASGPSSPRTAINGTGPNGPAGENFILYVWGGARPGAPARPGEVIEVPVADIRTSQGWLHRHRGSYEPHGEFHGQPRIPLVYWVDWVAQPYWALANDGNHRTFDAVRQGLERIQVKVVPVPDVVWPAKVRFLDSKVYADEDRARLSPIGRARDFFGVDRPDRFAPRARVTGEAPALPLPGSTLAAVLEAVRAGALSRWSERYAAATGEAERTNLRRARGLLETLRLEVAPTADVLAERSGPTLRVSSGLLAELHARGAHLPAAERPAFTARSLGLILAHEAAHAGGLRAERLADAEAVRILERAEGLGRVRGVALPLTPEEVRAVLGAFERPTGATRFDAFVARLRMLLRHGLPAARAATFERAARGEVTDTLVRWRRADGTLEWRRLLRDRALREAGGLAHFGLALFLKELAVVARTGDRLRIEEFFEGLLETDFYVHYGLFALGARAGEVAYGRYLARYVRPRFVSSVLRSNVALAAGIALPGLVSGDLDGRGFAISVTSLGLSSTAVKAGVASLGWVRDLATARRAGALGRLGRLGRLSGAAGWFYTAAETAVVLYVAEALETRVDRALSLRDARRALGRAGEAFARAVARAGATPAEVAAAAERYHEAWNDYRDVLAHPLQLEDARLAARLEGAAREAKLAADRRAEALERLERHPALKRRLEARHGSIEAWAAAQVAEDEARVAERVDEALAAHGRARAAILGELYPEGAAPHAYLSDLSPDELLRAGVAPGDPEDPYAGRTDPFAAVGRSLLHRRLRSALGDASPHRLGSYDDEAAALDLARRALEARGRPATAAALARTAAAVREARDLEAGLVRDALEGDLSGLADTVADQQQ